MGELVRLPVSGDLKPGINLSGTARQRKRPDVDTKSDKQMKRATYV
jgi:hypothetical protein